MNSQAIRLTRFVILSLLFALFVLLQRANADQVLNVREASIRTEDHVPRFERTQCDFPLPAGIPQDVNRECGYLFVPEVRGRANGRTFRLAVVIYRAKEPDGSPPLLLLHGGPGGFGGTRFPWTEMQFPLVRRRDVVAFDMRGVGRSEPKICPDFEQQAAFNGRTRKEWEESYRAAVSACVTTLDAQGLDRNAYGADVSASDAIDLRRALGYAKWDIYGVSYGGIVAQELLRRDSAGTRAAALVSTVAPGPDYSAQFMGYQQFLERAFGGCARDAMCHAAFPKLEEDFYALYEELSARPMEIPVAGATTPRTVLLNGERFLREMRREFQQPSTVRRLPLLVNEMRRGDREAAFRRLVAGRSDSPWDPLGHIVQCNEYGSLYGPAVAALIPKLRPPFQAIADDFREHCDLWLPNPTHQLDRRPIKSNIPTLVVHGEYDSIGMNIKDLQRRITTKLKRAYTYTFPGETHANAPVGCHGLIVQQFLENPLRAPDSSCLASMLPIQFRTNGFAPTLTFLISGIHKSETPFAGKWEATLVIGPDWTIQLEIDGSKVRGTVRNTVLPIYEGSIEGATLSFKIKSPDGARTITFIGRLQGDQLSFTREVEVVPGGNAGGPGLFGGALLRSFTAKRLR